MVVEVLSDASFESTALFPGLPRIFPLPFRKDLVEYQKTCEDLRERLKHKESLLAAGASSRVGGLCLKCAQHEAVLSQTHSNVHVQTIETLTK